MWVGCSHTCKAAAFWASPLSYAPSTGGAVMLTRSWRWPHMPTTAGLQRKQNIVRIIVESPTLLSKLILYSWLPLPTLSFCAYTLLTLPPPGLFARSGCTSLLAQWGSPEEGGPRSFVDRTSGAPCPWGSSAPPQSYLFLWDHFSADHICSCGDKLPFEVNMVS